MASSTSAELDSDPAIGGVGVALSQLARAVADARLYRDAEVRSLAYDSRCVQPGALFFAVRGSDHDGHLFVGEAIQKGAAGIVVERPIPGEVARLEVASVRAAMGPISAAFYGQPACRLITVGVTGTNGKTTTCELIRSIFEAAGRRCGQIGTTGIRWDGHFLESRLTTPEAPDLQAAMRAMLDQGTVAVAMEVSSHSLDRYRVEGICFDVAVFTNLSPEHLDYHGTMEHYFASKARLFEDSRCRRAVVCIDDEWGRRLASQVKQEVITYGTSREADVRVMARSRGLAGIEVSLSGMDGDVEIRIPIPGGVNAKNAAAAYLACRLGGVDREAAVAGLRRATTPPGRFELIRAGQPFLVVVDYAHTPDALEELLRTVRGIIGRRGRIFLVVGARGGRDRFKRPAIGRVAALHADRVVLTTDSPGREDPGSIIAQLLLGAAEVDSSRVMVEPDRRQAIALAIEQARPGDAVVMVGRGHERYQEMGDRKVYLDDREAASEILLELGWKPEE
jgi:UDP-N-acetylmuramoyl-L-alanyl-D-glutamate--2,6-diaminopimelate ligase